jgi:MoaA/NifB/PqqE/SkfB family radical SAM enzyme
MRILPRLEELKLIWARFLSRKSLSMGARRGHEESASTVKQGSGATMLNDSQLNVYNITKMRTQEPREFDFLRFDSNNDCNVHCVYCHNHRSSDLVDTEEFRAFLKENVIGINNFQVGCIMEPTLDPRLCDLMLMTANSQGRPSKTFLLQTNGILLHKHDHSKMRDAGLTHLSVSIDAADPVTHKLLRGGTSLAKVHSNLVAFREACPTVEVVFISTVTSMNIHAMEALVTFGLTLGVAKFVLREMFYYPDNNMVDHAKMPALLLEENAFAGMKQSLVAKFGKRASFEFADAPFLDRALNKMKADSFR